MVPHEVLRSMRGDPGQRKTASLVKRGSPGVFNLWAWDLLRKAPDQSEGQHSGAGRS